MKRSINWNILSTVLIVISWVIIVSFFTSLSFLQVSKSTWISKQASSSIIEANNIIISDNNNLWSLNPSIRQQQASIELSRDSTIELTIPETSISNWDSLWISFWDTWPHILWLEVEKSNKGDYILNKKIDTRGWFILADSSVWSSWEQATNTQLQFQYLDSWDINWLSNFIESEISKFWKAGSYLIFDFWDFINLNRFDFQLTSEGNSTYPEVLQVSLDDWLKHIFFVDPTSETQSFIFPDTVTRYIKLDLIALKNWEVESWNAAIINNLSWNILESDIILNDLWDWRLEIVVNELQSITGISFVNVYWGKNGNISFNPFYSFVPNDNSFNYNLSTNWSINELYFEICSDIGICNPKIRKIIR